MRYSAHPSTASSDAAVAIDPATVGPRPALLAGALRVGYLAGPGELQ